MTVKMDITTEEIIVGMQEALANASAPDDLGLSAREWARYWDVTAKTARRRLHKVNDMGLLIVGRKKMPGLDGQVRDIPVYRVKGE